MNHKIICIIVSLGLLLLGCADNEASVFVKEMKVPASQPDCTSTTSDAFTPLGLLDLSFRNPYTSYFLLENRLMAREDYSKPTAETSGIFIEGSEVSVRAVDGTPLGSSDYYEFEGFVPPESEAIIFASVIPTATAAIIAQQLGCPEVPNLAMGTSVHYTMVYADVKFVGHTNGGTDVETPSFTVGVELCCGCLINWLNCTDECNRFCEDIEPSGMCVEGVGNGGDGYDCRNIFHDETATWQETETDPSGNQVQVTRTCADC